MPREVVLSSGVLCWAMRHVVFWYAKLCYDMLYFGVMCDYIRFYDTIRSLMPLYVLLCYAVSLYVLI